MDDSLIRQSRLARNTRPLSLRPCEVWGHGDFLHICFSSVGCRFRQAGYCTMCDYGGSCNVTPGEAISGLRDALNGAECFVREILLGTCGSILDEREMAWKTLRVILDAVYQSGIPSVILETHYTTVTPKVLARIREALPDREVIIELGFESSNPWVLEHSLCKYMNRDALADTVERIHRFHMEAVLNVFLGAPFLSPRNQIRDAHASIAWAAAHGASRVVVFPANLKPNTLLWKLWQDGSYRRLSHWMLIELLSELERPLLEKVELSWYGDRQDKGQATQILPPEDCPVCHGMLMDFYQAFMKDFDPMYRQRLLERLRTQATCSCRKEVLASLKENTEDEA